MVPYQRKVLETFIAAIFLNKRRPVAKIRTLLIVLHNAPLDAVLSGHQGSYIVFVVDQSLTWTKTHTRRAYRIMLPSVRSDWEKIKKHS